MGHEHEQGHTPGSRRAGSGPGHRGQRQALSSGMAAQHICTCLGAVHMRWEQRGQE